MSFTQAFEWFVRGVITSESYARNGCAETVRDAQDAHGSIRGVLKEPGRGGLGREDWVDIARWFLNAKRVHTLL